MPIFDNEAKFAQLNSRNSLKIPNYLIYWNFIANVCQYQCN